MEFPGAIYHVLNRGNYRQDLFETAGAAQAFVDCLWEVCKQTKWVKDPGGQLLMLVVVRLG